MPPVACYPTTSQAGVAVLCPLAEALVAGLVKDPIGLADGSVSVDDSVTVGSLGAGFESTTPLGVGLGEVQEQGSPEGSDHTGLGNEPSSTRLSIAHKGGKATGRDQLDHRSGARGG